MYISAGNEPSRAFMCLTNAATVNRSRSLGCRNYDAPLLVAGLFFYDQAETEHGFTADIRRSCADQFRLKASAAAVAIRSVTAGAKMSPVRPKRRCIMNRTGRYTMPFCSRAVKVA